MINLRYIKEAIRLNRIPEPDAETIAAFQYNMYLAAQEVEKARTEPRPTPDFLNQYRKAS